MTHVASAQIRADGEPRPEDFPEWPAGWYVAARSDELSRRPIGVELFGRRLVCYRSASGQAVAMDARCRHMGADLSAGAVVGDRIVCPFHGWRFGPSGQCEVIPAQAVIPPCARQRTYSTAESGGRVFVFPSNEAVYPLPFFRLTKASDLVAAPSFEFVLNCPWWLIGANGFDVQHFAAAHDRRLVGNPVVESPHPAARRIVTTFEVGGQDWRDRLTRTFAGRRVTMDVTVWSGTLAFVIARFHDSDSSDDSAAAATSYGMTEIRPVGSAPDTTSLVRVTIHRRCRRGLRAIDWLDVRIKRHFIRAFLRSDTRTLDGVRYDPDHLIQADAWMIDYLRWLVTASRGKSNR